MKLHIYESVYHDLRCVKATAIIYKSVKKGIPRKYQKTWSMKTVAPEFTIQQMRPSIEAEARRWEAKTMALLERNRQLQKEILQEKIVLGTKPVQTTMPCSVDPGQPSAACAPLS